jgi:tetrahydromethanopterin S-methyltransferase subunit F/predicted small secreted protein
MTNPDVYIKWKNFTTEGKYKIYFMSNEDEWKNKLEDLKKYIDENNKLPVYSNETKNNKILCKWLCHQQQNFKNKINIISTQPIADKWIEFINDIKYKNYFMTNEDDWNCKLEDVKKYIDENNKRPSTRDKYSSYNLGTWISTQLGNSKKKIQIMSNTSIYDKWNEFVNDIKYKKYFISHEDDWNLQLIELKKYIDENKKIPSSRDTNKDIQYLGNWFRKQKEKYKTKTQIMANTDIYSKWTEFINDKKYLSYFLTNEELWEKKFKEVKKYIDENNKKPLNTDNNKDIKTLSNWISAQQSYKNKNENKNSKWNEFINNEKYKKLFITIEDEWYNNLNKIKIYIDENNKKPVQRHKNYDINVLGSWIQSQVQNYKKKRFNMTNPILYKEWSTFINDEKYKKYFN